MTTANNLRKILHRKAWESVTSAPVATNAGAFVVNDSYNMLDRIGAVFVAGASSIYLYLASEDAWVQLPNSGIAGTFAAGACGSLRALGAMGGVFTQTATAGTTTTITTNRTIIKSLAGCRIRVVAGTGIGYDSTITRNTLGANAIPNCSCQWSSIRRHNSISNLFRFSVVYECWNFCCWFFCS